MGERTVRRTLPIRDPGLDCHRRRPGNLGSNDDPSLGTLGVHESSQSGPDIRSKEVV